MVSVMLWRAGRPGVCWARKSWQQREGVVPRNEGVTSSPVADIHTNSFKDHTPFQNPAHRRSQMATVLSVLPLTTRGPVLSMPVTMALCALHMWVLNHTERS